MARKSEEKVKYLVLANPDFVIEVPADWKLTFGYVNPAQPERGMGGQSAHCLRCYEGQKLRAVFGNVRGFRDMAIPLARKNESETGSASWRRDSEGSFEEHKQLEVSSSFEVDGTAEEVPF